MTAAAFPEISEAEFQAHVIQLAELLGWHVMHVRRSRARSDQWATTTSIAGWPDLFMWHETQGRTIAAELKSKRGKTTPEQTAVLASLAAAGLEVRIWRPADWTTDVEPSLRGRT